MFVLYLLAGIILFAVWPKASLELRTAFAILFPLHAIVGVWIHACVNHQGKFLDNPLWYGVLVVILAIIVICGV